MLCNNARFRSVYAIVNVGQLEVAFADGEKVDADAIRKAGFADVGTRRLTFGVAALHTGRRP